jgi:two-component system NtrC family sensor kinase
MTLGAWLRRARPRVRLWMKLAFFGAFGVIVTHTIHVLLASRIATNALLEQQSALGRNVARLVAREVAEAVVVNDAIAVHDTVANAARGEGVAYCFVTRAGRVVATSFTGLTPTDLVALRAGGGDAAPIVVRDGGRRVLDLTEPVVGASATSVRVGLPLAIVETTEADLVRMLGALAVALTAAGLAAAFVVGRAIAMPVGALLAAADRFDPGAPPAPIEPRGSDEIAEVTDRFNRMMARLGAAHEEQTRARARAVETERMAALGLLVGGVAHEVNNPLAGLKNCVRRLERADLPDAKRAEYLELMNDGLERIEDVVKRLLDYGRPQALALVDVPLATLADDGVRMLLPALRRRSVGYELDTKGPLATARARADARQVGQALVNLVLNAAYVTPKGGSIRVSLRERPGQLGVAVEDRGPGIPEAIRDRVVLPFFSTKPPGEGTGLGLSVTRTIVDAHGGELAFEFPEQGGTIATIWLRRADAA